VHDALALRPSGEHREVPEVELAGARLGTEWYLVVANRCDHPLVAETTLRLLSSRVDLVACSVEEHVMFSAASFWSAGRRVWSVSHDAQTAIDHLEVSGTLPPFFSEVRDTHLERQASEGGAAADVDFVFDVPLELARRIAGFRHDAAGEGERFEVLVAEIGSPVGGRKPFWKV
jgi:hypothetical protein